MRGIVSFGLPSFVRREVLQLETAMGAAISCFPGATAVVIPRSRFAPATWMQKIDRHGQRRCWNACSGEDDERPARS